MKQLAMAKHMEICNLQEWAHHDIHTTRSPFLQPEDFRKARSGAMLYLGTPFTICKLRSAYYFGLTIYSTGGAVFSLPYMDLSRLVQSTSSQRQPLTDVKPEILRSQDDDVYILYARKCSEDRHRRRIAD